MQQAVQREKNEVLTKYHIYIYRRKEEEGKEQKRREEFRRLWKNFVAEMGPILQQKGERIKDILDKFQHVKMRRKEEEEVKSDLTSFVGISTFGSFCKSDHRCGK